MLREKWLQCYCACYYLLRSSHIFSTTTKKKIPPKQRFCTIFLLVFPWFIHCKTAEPCVNVIVIPAIKLHHLSDRQEWPKRSVQNSWNMVYWKELTQMARVGGVSSYCGHRAEMMWSWGWQLPLTEGWERRKAGEQVLESSCKSLPLGVFRSRTIHLWVQVRVTFSLPC